MKNLFLTGMLLISQVAHSEEAKFFRFWQGYRLPNLSSEEFVNRLPPFMQMTLDVYHGKGLVNYIVAIPPNSKPAFVPDEFALVAFDSEESYRTVRSTPEGKAYGDRHWDLFDKNISKSANMLGLNSDVKELELNTAYNVLEKPVPLNDTYVTFFIGLRKKDVTEESFKNRMLKHLLLVRGSFEAEGLVGYLALVQRNYEVAYQVWESKEAAEKAFASEAGKIVVQDASELMDTLMFKETQIHKGSSVVKGAVYQSLP